MPNPEAYEHDMDLREEKEKQRTALILLRDLSNTDESFGNKFQTELTKIGGLSIPPISRLEARASSSRTTTSGGFRSSSTRIYSTSTSRGGVGGGYYQQVQGSGGGHVSDSVVVMELGTSTTPNSRAKTAMTAT